MGGRRDQNGSVVPSQTVGHEGRDPVVEERFLLVVLDEVPVAGGRDDPVRGH
jgi:hypothetical protein